MKTLIPPLLLAFAVTASGGPETGPEYVLASREARSVAVSIVRPADFVAVPISIVSDQKEQSLRFDDIRTAKRLIKEKANTGQRIIVKEGSLSLSASPGARSGHASVASGDAMPTAVLTLMVALDPQAPDVFAAAGEITRFMAGVKVGEKARCNLGQVQLAVADPEQYRTDLLKRITQDIRRAKELMGREGSLAVTGLESPVLVRQTDESNVELFLNYAVTLTELE